MSLQLTDDNFEKQVVEADKPVLVDFHAPWCGPCQMAGPVIDELAKEYEEKILIGKVNVDDNPKIAQNFGVMSIPTVIIFQGGKEVKRLTGFPGKAGYEELINSVLSS